MKKLLIVVTLLFSTNLLGDSKTISLELIDNYKSKAKHSGYRMNSLEENAFSKIKLSLDYALFDVEEKLSMNDIKGAIKSLKENYIPTAEAVAGFLHFKSRRKEDARSNSLIDVGVKLRNSLVTGEEKSYRSLRSSCAGCHQ